MALHHTDTFAAIAGRMTPHSLRVDAPDGRYPRHLATTLQLPDGTPVLARPIAPQDRRRHWHFVRGLSLQTRYQRLMSPRCLLPGELRRMVDIDYRREMALVAVVPATPEATMPRPAVRRLAAASPTSVEVEVAVARYVLGEDGDSAEFAMVVTDAWQRRGLGLRLLERLMTVAADAGVRELRGITLATNTPMIRLARRLGFGLSPEPGDWTVKRLRRLLGPGQPSDAASPGGTFPVATAQ
jgi:acetyltransferase